MILRAHGLLTHLVPRAGQIAVKKLRKATSKTHASVVMASTEASLPLILAGRSRPVCTARTIVVLIILSAEIVWEHKIGKTKDS